MNINDLKVGDIVFIREDLKDDKMYGNNVYIDDMCSGVQKIKSIYKDYENFTVFGSFAYSYTSEMVDWEKTKKLQSNNYCEFEKITQFVESGKEKTVALTNNGKEFVVINNDKENDIEKAVMLLMLKNLGVTYSEIKREVEKVKVKWKPTEDDRYYYIREIGDVSSCFWSELSWDYYRFDFNNCFKTKEDAEEKLEKIKEVLRGE